jgi:hypothetical protein
MDWARMGLHALEQLRRTGSQRQQYQEHRPFLKKSLALAAHSFLVMRQHSYAQPEVVTRRIPSSQQEMMAFRREIELELTQHRQWLGRSREAHKIMLDAKRLQLLNAEDADNGNYWAVHHLVVESVPIVVLMHKLMLSHAEGFNSEIIHALALQGQWII